MKNILYICDGNVARSQEAETFTNELGKGNYSASSAGTDPKVGKQIDPMVISVMQELGYDMAKSFRKPIDEQVVSKADLIISFKNADELPESVRSRKNVRYWTITDPRGQSIEVHRETRDIIKAGVEALLKEND
jgi:arsenate reductase (thioredoxin)